MTCTKTSTKCKQHHVSGFPTVFLFRTIQTQQSNCIPPDLVLEPSWVDYHGVFEVIFHSKKKNKIISTMVNVMSSILEQETLHENVVILNV